MNEYMVEKYRQLNAFAQKGQILFVGSSLMEHFPINEILMSRGLSTVIYNRGISGYTIPELLESMDEQIFDLEPSVIFINIGTNDISRPEETAEGFEADYRNVLSQIKERLAKTKVYVMAYYPVNVELAKKVVAWPEAPLAAELRLQRLDKANAIAESLAKEMGYEFINVNDGLAGVDGQTRKEYSTDGIHMWPKAYEIIFDNMSKYIF
ncbi:MAG: lysophospholipase [Butyrivibrio sp.]|uniref:GDSL-type esterase/lipase family protein n=1 Tax=Butyrivibrio sp. TaxID=28121 RepID=UPI001B5FA8E3|nr:GDSL-type esterase/lipase family protein [Butyrivibrio sp.]MBP3782827.1 lysophospholipase [Butyrivibrio sp.]